MTFVDRYITIRDSLRALIRDTKPDRVGIEYPIMNAIYSEGMYGLFLYSCEALKTEGCDVVFWSPLQVKAHARETLDRPKGWVMDKKDMIDAAMKDASGSRWNHNEADAYLVARISARFWRVWSDEDLPGGMTSTEVKYFTEIKTFARGKFAGQSKKTGVIYREDERFFLWSNSLKAGDSGNG